MTLTVNITWDASGEPRACQLCDYGRNILRDGARRCTHPEAPSRDEAAHVTACRAFGGFCGPDAKHLTFPGLRAPLTPSELTP